MMLESLGNARAEVRKLANIQNATAFITDADVNTLLNTAWTRVYRELCRSAQNYYITSVQFTTVPLQDTYYTTANSLAPGPLPTDIWTIKGLNLLFQGGSPPIWRDCYTFEYEQRNSRQPSGGTAWPNTAYQYAFYGAGPTLPRLVLIPVPTVVDTLRLDYYPNAQVLVADGDQWDGQNGWDHLAIAIAARWCAIKDENYDLIPHLDADIVSWTQQLKGEAASRNSEEAPKMRRTRYRSRGRYNPWGYGSNWWQ